MNEWDLLSLFLVESTAPVSSCQFPVSLCGGISFLGAVKEADSIIVPRYIVVDGIVREERERKEKTEKIDNVLKKAYGHRRLAPGKVIPE